MNISRPLCNHLNRQVLVTDFAPSVESRSISEIVHKVSPDAPRIVGRFLIVAGAAPCERTKCDAGGAHIDSYVCVPECCHKPTDGIADIQSNVCATRATWFFPQPPEPSTYLTPDTYPLLRDFAQAPLSIK